MKGILKGCKLALGLLAVLTIGNQSYGYDIIKRTKLNDDRLKLMESLRPFGHDFIFDTNIAVTPETSKLLDDVGAITDKPAGTTQDEVLTLANQILPKYYNKENLLNARVTLGFPIFSFNAFGFNIRPNFRAHVGVIANLTPTEGVFSIASAADTLSTLGLPASVVTALKNCNYDAIANGAVVLDACETQGAITASDKAAIVAILGSKAGDWKKTASLSTNTTIPVFNIYSKGEAKIGFPVDFTRGDHWFGTMFLGGLMRADFNKSCDAMMIYLGTCKIEFSDPNTVTNTIVDAKVGYRNTNYSVYASAEEVKVAEMSKKDTGAPLAYGSDPLLRLQANAKYHLWIFSADSFIGAHSRTGYGFGDSYYLGVDWAAHLWKDRLGFTLRTMADKEHFTLGTRFKLWLMHLELMAKEPIANEVDGVKVSEIYSVDLRFFF